MFLVTRDSSIKSSANFCDNNFVARIRNAGDSNLELGEIEDRHKTNARTTGNAAVGKESVELGKIQEP